MSGPGPAGAGPALLPSREVRIDGAVLREIRLRLRRPFEISSGVRSERRVLLLTLTAGGATGWSECVAAEDPGYSYETTETAWHVLTDFLLPAVVGRTADLPGGVLEPVRWVRGHRMARAAVEMAAWDVRARLEGLPLARLLGGSPEPVPVGVSVGLQADDDALLARIEGFLDEGYRRIKVKIKPGRDVEMLRKVRDRFPEVPLMADANSAYAPDDLPRLRELDDLDLMMIEQPLAWDDLLEHARLQEALRTPICLDESIRSAGDLRLALELGACRVVNLKPGRVGGLGPSLEIHRICLERGVDLWCGGMLESGVGRAHNLALATLPGFTLPGDISGSRRYWERDVVDPEFVVEDGTLTPSEEPGIGVRPDEGRIGGLTVRTASFGRSG